MDDDGADDHVGERSDVARAAANALCSDFDGLVDRRMLQSHLAKSCVRAMDQVGQLGEGIRRGELPNLRHHLVASCRLDC